MLAVFSAPAPQRSRQASPERVGEYRQTQLFYRALSKSVKPRHRSAGIFTDKTPSG